MRHSTTPTSSGIYLIRNTANHKYYIGSALNLRERWQTHRANLKAGSHHNPHLQAAWNKYGSEAFEFEVLEIVTKECQLAEREIYWMRLHNVPFNQNCYNIRLYAESNRGYRHSDEAKQRMSKAQAIVQWTPERRAKSGETLRQYNLSRRGKPKSEQHRSKIAQSNTGKRHSLESKMKMSRNATGRPKPHLYKAIFQLSHYGTVIREFSSVSEAARTMGVTVSNISNCLNGRSKTAAGFIWRYANVPKG